jgi:hypothetical protein
MKRKLSIAVSLVVILTMTLASLALAADPPAQVVFTTDLPCPVSVLVISYTDPTGVVVNFVSGSTPWTLDTFPSTPPAAIYYVAFSYPTSVVCNGVTYTFISVTPSNPVPSGAAGTITTVTAHYLDTTPPTLNLPGNITVEATSASGAAVAYTATADDANPAHPAVFCEPASGAPFGLGMTTVSCSATDAAGNTANGSFTVTVQDTTPPVLTLPSDITVNAPGASGAVVNFTASANDSVDGPVPVICSPASGLLFQIGTTTVRCTATDSHTNAASGGFNVTVILIDTTPPVWTVPADFSVPATGPDGAVVNYVASASDPDDAVISQSCSPASGATFALGPTTVNCTATDAHGNIGTAHFIVTVVDTTPPTITFVSRLPAANALGWNNTDVTVTWSCSDIEGVLSPTVTQIVSMEGSALSATGTCTDTSGNTASDTQTGFNIDKTAPSLSPTVSPNPVTLNDSATVNANASDGLSGLDTVNCGALDTSSVGSKFVTCTATDKTGNFNSVSVSYTVQYATSDTNCKGVPGHQILQPINADGSSVFEQGRTVPAKFRVCGADGNPIGSEGVVTNFRLIQIISQDVVSNVDQTVESTPPFDVFRSGQGQWIFNISTEELLADNTYVYLITLNDRSTIQFQFSLK